MTMNRERFQQLIQAYGADPSRWPLADRAQAESLRLADPEARAAAETEGALDDALDAWKPQFPTMDLRNRILAAAPKPRSVAPARGWRPLWLGGAGLAAACAAGVVVGAAVIAPSLANAFPVDHAEAASSLADGVSVFGSTLDAESAG